MKKSALLFFVLCPLITQAQFYKSVIPDKKFSEPLSLIVKAFKNNYSILKGDEELADGISHHYECIIKLPGEITSGLVYYNSKEDTSDAYEALFYQGDDYKTAARIYRSLCYDVKKPMKWTGSSYAQFRGNIEDPSPGQKFTTTLLHFDQPEKIYRDYYAQVDFILLVGKFTVTLNLVTKKPDDIE